MKKECVYFAFLVLVFVCGLLTGRRSVSRVSSRGHADTVTVVSVRTDTLRIATPVPVLSRITDTMRVPVADTLRVRDTVYIALPREERVYGDSLYRAQVSGYRPELDWIEVYPRTETVTKFITERPRWSLGIQAGYGASKDGLSPYVGVGVSYYLFSW